LTNQLKYIPSLLEADHIDPSPEPTKIPFPGSCPPWTTSANCNVCLVPGLSAEQSFGAPPSSERTSCGVALHFTLHQVPVLDVAMQGASSVALHGSHPHPRSHPSLLMNSLPLPHWVELICSLGSSYERHLNGGRELPPSAGSFPSHLP
jgi:hypothetical protein